MYGWYNVWMDWFKLHDDLQNEIHRRFNAHLHFPFSYVMLGGEPSVEFETALLLCRYSRSSISSSQILGSGLFLNKLSKHLCI